MFSPFLPYVGMVVTLVVCGLAFLRGGPPERVGAGLVLGVALIGQAIDLILPDAHEQVAHLCNDAFLAVGFLLVALRYGSLWLGGSMMLQAVQFSLHAFYLVATKPHDRFFAVVNNANTAGIIACILAGTLVAWRHHKKSIVPVLGASGASAH
ncbi:MAG: hypothetical protein Q8M88_05560 [Phenylobacterium sp.]|uniref:hypothetical protein n=1 Tax=Phenylobacterium sp. TaxID=1871053 RepID=UPI0027349B4E|nr:hypothetical protein [Phenylobacterium sp.]MDP3173883.1 hypothetical protein [Phenylobacterium sp.]